MDQSAQKALEQALKGPKFEKRIKRRNLVDKGWASSISVRWRRGYLSVLLIMFFLVYVVAPLFMPASVKEHASYALPGGSQEKTLFYGMDEYKETAMRITESGKLIGFNANNGQLLTESSLPLNGESITSFARVKESDKLIAFGLSGGGVLLAKYGYKVTYPDNVRKITPALTFPFGQEPLVVADQPISKVAARSSDSQLVVAYQLAGQSHVFVKQYDKVESMLSDDVALEEYAEGEVPNNMPVDWLMMGGNMRNLYLVSEDGSTLYYDLSNIREPVLLQKVNMVNGDEHISSLRFLLGEYSLMVGTSKGRVLQWFPVRDENNNFQLEFIREFEVDKKPVNFIAIEHSRKGFVTLDRSDEVNLYNATAERHLASVDLKTGLNFILMAERGNGALLETADGQMVNYDIKNEHPDVSFSSLWGKVWYEATKSQAIPGSLHPPVPTSSRNSPWCR